MLEKRKNKSLENQRKWTQNGAKIHQQSIKNRCQNRCRKMDVQKSIKIEPWGVLGRPADPRTFAKPCGALGPWGASRAGL